MSKAGFLPSMVFTMKIGWKKTMFTLHLVYLLIHRLIYGSLLNRLLRFRNLRCITRSRTLPIEAAENQDVSNKQIGIFFTNKHREFTLRLDRIKENTPWFYSWLLEKTNWTNWFLFNQKEMRPRNFGVQCLKVKNLPTQFGDNWYSDIQLTEIWVPYG